MAFLFDDTDDIECAAFGYTEAEQGVDGEAGEKTSCPARFDLGASDPHAGGPIPSGTTFMVTRGL